MRSDIPVAWFTEVTRGQIEISLLVSIRESFSPDVEHKFVTNAHMVQVTGRDPSAEDVSPVGTSIDPVTRESNVSEWEFIFVDDGVIRLLNSLVRLKGKPMTVKIGTTEMAEATFVTWKDGLIIDDITTSETDAVIKAHDEMAVAVDAEIEKFFYSRPPLDIFSILLAPLGLPASVFSDSSMDEKSHTETSHHVVTRHNYNYLLEEFDTWLPMQENSPGKAIDMLQDLMSILYSSLIPSELGGFKFVPFDIGASTVDDWTADDITDYEPESTYRHIVNQVGVEFQKSDNENVKLVVGNDTQSQTDFGYPTLGPPIPRIFPKTFISSWLNARVPMDVAQSFDAAATILNVFNLPLYRGFSGTVMEDAAGNEEQAPTVGAGPPDHTSQQPEHQLSAARPAYFWITDHEGNDEIIKAEDFEYFSSASALRRTIDTPLGQHTYWEGGFFTVVRGAVGGGFPVQTPVDWESIYRPPPIGLGRLVMIYDITIAQRVVDLMIQRLSNGMPVIKVRTGLHKLAIELGDFITIEETAFSSYGHTQATQDIVWEIVGKEVRPLDDSPGIVWTLAWVRDGAVTVGIPELEPPPSDTVIGGSNNPLEPLLFDDLSLVLDNFGTKYFQG